MDLFSYANSPVETEEIGAAAEEHMLAVVDDFTDPGMKVRRGAPAKITSAFDELDPETGFGECAGSAHTSDTTTDDSHSGLFELAQTVQEDTSELATSQ
jgi:hypothetical protein